MQLHSSNHLLGKRLAPRDAIYCVTARVDQDCPVFDDWRLGRRVVDELRALEAEGLAHTLAWVIMPDHLQWLVQLNQRPLPTLMCRLKSRSTLTVNAARQTCGRLWAPGYQERLVEAEVDPRVIARQLISAPQHAGLVTRAGDYPLWDAVWL